MGLDLAPVGGGGWGEGKTAGFGQYDQLVMVGMLSVLVTHPPHLASCSWQSSSWSSLGIALKGSPDHEG